MGFFSHSFVLFSCVLFTAFAAPAPPSIDDVPLPPGVPRKIKLTDRPNDPAGKLVKVRVGPFAVPPNTMFAAVPEMAGGRPVEKPCEECWLGAFQGGMEYEDGTEANVDTGIYLHHYVVVNAQKPDWYCGLKFGAFPMPQYVYNSGNERPPVRLNNKYRFGMRVDKQDKFSTALEIMNMSNETKTVYATTIYEVIPLDTPGYREATHLRIDIWQCGGSDVPAKKGNYTYTSPDYISQYSGVILHSDGHGHDGTTHVDLLQNEKVICRSEQHYGLRPGWKAPAHLAHAHAAEHGAAMQYISDAVACEDEGRIEVGDKLKTIAYYDDTKYPQMTFKGHLEPQMGISFLYIGRDEVTLKNKLKLERSTGIGFPIEMVADMEKKMPPAPAAPPAGPPPSANPPSPPSEDMFEKFALAQLNLPPGFDLDKNPWVDAPMPPRPFMGANSLDTIVPASFPKNLLPNVTIADIVGDKALQNKTTELMKAFIPGLAPDFHINKIFTGGGIDMSESKKLQKLLRKNSGFKSPLEELGVDHSHGRAAAGLLI